MQAEVRTNKEQSPPQPAKRRRKEQVDTGARGYFAKSDANPRSTQKLSESHKSETRATTNNNIMSSSQTQETLITASSAL
jgi:hypothetical protein